MAWLTLPNPSRWLIRTIRLSYAIQFARHLPRFSDVLFNSVAEKEACVLCAEIAVLLAKIIIDPVPPAKIEVFLQPLLHCTKGKRWVETNVEVCALNQAIH